MEMLKIGYVLDSYPEKRCIIGKTKNQYVYFNLRRSFTYLVKLLFIRLGICSTWDVMACLDVPSRKVDVWHTFNEIPRTNDPFIITFESAVPRNSETLARRWEWDDTYEKKYLPKTSRQIQRLYRNNCKRLLALSQNTLDVMRYQMEMLNIEPEVADSIMKKVDVLYPPQDINCTLDELKKKYKAPKKMKFVFVGNDFFRKGGGMLLSALNTIDTKNIDLTIISSFVPDTIFGYSEVEQKRIIEFCKAQSWITCLQNVPNDRVMEILKESHVGFLPTIQDTFGYSVLEMQASGCPIVTTDIRALGEINNNNLGWVIPIKKHPISKEAFYHDKDELLKARQKIEEGLFEIIKELVCKWEQREIDYFENKAQKCLDRISEWNNPIRYEERLSEIYQSTAVAGRKK